MHVCPLNAPGMWCSVSLSTSLRMGDEFSIRVITGKLHGPDAAVIAGLSQLKEEQIFS